MRHGIPITLPFDDMDSEENSVEVGKSAKRRPRCLTVLAFCGACYSNQAKRPHGDAQYSDHGPGDLGAAAGRSACVLQSRFDAHPRTPNRVKGNKSAG